MKPECCNIVLNEKDKKNLSYENELDGKMAKKWELCERNECDSCKETVINFFYDNQKTDYYYRLDDGWVVGNTSDYLIDDVLIEYLVKNLQEEYSPVPFVDEKFIFFSEDFLKKTEDLLKKIEEFYKEDWVFEIEYKNVKYEAVIEANRDCHHRSLSDDDFFDENENRLSEILEKNGVEGFCYSIRIKDHSFSSGAGSIHGFSAPDFELVLSDDDFETDDHDDYRFKQFSLFCGIQSEIEGYLI